jgi:hypothetical protein
MPAESLPAIRAAISRIRQTGECGLIRAGLQAMDDSRFYFVPVLPARGGVHMTRPERSRSCSRLSTRSLLGGLLLVGLVGVPARAQAVDTAGVKAAILAAVLRLPDGEGLVALDSAGADSSLFRCLRVVENTSAVCRATPLPRVLVISRVRVRGDQGDAVAAVYSPKATRDGVDITEIEVLLTRQGSVWRVQIERITVSEAFID